MWMRVVDEASAILIDEELNRILASLEEEIEWGTFPLGLEWVRLICLKIPGEDRESISSSINAAVSDAQQRKAFKAMLEATFVAYDKDGDGSLDEYAFELVALFEDRFRDILRQLEKNLRGMRRILSQKTWRLM
jgi:hypothetical protein